MRVYQRICRFNFPKNGEISILISRKFGRFQSAQICADWYTPLADTPQLPENSVG